MRTRKLITLLMLSGGVSLLAACGTYDSPGAEAEETAQGLGVIDAVQLGAEQGCHGLADRVGGNLTITELEDSPDVVLVLEDGYPLCFDTLEFVAGELERIELIYSEVPDAVPEEADEPEAVQKMMLETEDNSGERDTDPNPQPALESGFSAQLLNLAGGGVDRGKSGPQTEPVPDPTPDNPTHAESD